MKVTLKLPDDLVRKARHRAVDESKSLSAWMTHLVQRELAEPASTQKEPQTWMDALKVSDAPEWFYEKDFPLPDRKQTKHREFTFEPEYV